MFFALWFGGGLAMEAAARYHAFEWRAAGPRLRGSIFEVMAAGTAIVLFSAFLAAPEGWIAYVSGTDQETRQVSVLHLGDGEPVRVGGTDGDGMPVWSPDGQWLAFSTKTEGGLGIRVVRADGTEGRTLPSSSDWNHEPRWSPDSRRLAWAADTGGGILQSVMVHELGPGTESAWGGGVQGLLRPVWLPSTDLMKALDPADKESMEKAGLVALKEEADAGGVLLALALGESQGGLCTEPALVTATKSVPMLALISKDSTRFSEWCVEPDHDGRQIAYESNDGGDREIYVLGRRGIINVTNHRAADWNPVWSNDDKWLAIESFRGGRRGVYQVLVSTGNAITIAAPDNGECWHPTWSPDDEWIAHASTEAGAPQIFARPAGGGEPAQLTSEPGGALAPAWRPKVKTPKEDRP